MFPKKDVMASLDGMEIGATGPQRLQIVLKVEGRRITLPLTSEEARWLASALVIWADNSDTIRSN